MFTNTRFPEDISYGSTGGPQFSTQAALTQSGQEYRNRNWLQARMRYQIELGLRTPKQIETLLNFFYARGGRAEGFRYKDWSDYQAKDQIMGVGDGQRTQFQLVKQYGSNPGYRRIITKPVTNTVVVKMNDVLVGQGILVDYNSGVVTFANAPLTGATLRASFEFDVPVRFDSDHLPITQQSKGLFTVDKINLIEIAG